MSEPLFTKELVDSLARFLASQDGQDPDGIYKVAGSPMPAWMGYRDSAVAVLLFLSAKGFQKEHST